jgi:DNA-binding protein YbaB
MEAQPATDRPITATAAGYPGASPEYVTVTIAGVAHVVDVTVDRDDWQLPEVEGVDDIRILWAIDDAIEVWRAANEPESTRLERTWARSVA